MESALAGFARRRTGDCAVALDALDATRSRGRRGGGNRWWSAGGCYVGQGDGTTGQRSSSVASGRGVLAYTHHRIGCCGIHAVKRLRKSPVTNEGAFGMVGRDES